MPGLSADYDAYKRVNVETASQGKLIVMLFSGAIQRAHEAKRQMEKGNSQGVHDHLIRAQEIVSELRGSLNMKAGAIATDLDRIYEYFQHLLVKANVRKESAPIDECVELMTRMRDTWQEVFDQMARNSPSPVPTPPKHNQHGASMINVKG